jgi:hypothetical protein
MLLVLEPDVADLAATRFAISPLCETVRAVRLPVLEADIAYRAALLAGGGALSLFGDLHADLRWSEGTITLRDDDEDHSSCFRIMPGPDGVVLMPSVFNWPEVSLSRATSSQTILLFPARGAATAWDAFRDHGDGAVEALLGVPRSPATTSALALLRSSS